MHSAIYDALFKFFKIHYHQQMKWDFFGSLERRRPKLLRYKLLIRADNAGGVRIQLPSRLSLPDFQEMFPVLNKLTLYKEICRFEELGTTWLKQCTELLPYLEDENRNQSCKLEKHIYESALEALEAWNHQASLIGSWNKLLGW
jgi:hypothetical protein